MEIHYDKEADALYITFRAGKFARNRKVDDTTILDLDAKGNILGIELLSASKRFPPAALAEVRVKNMTVATA
jgi:uncharacterized protein YuzE